VRAPPTQEPARPGRRAESDRSDVASWRGRIDAALAPGLESLLVWPVAHWLLLANLLAGLTVLGALATPLLRWAGLDPSAAWIEALYRHICPQRPSHSFFWLGHQVPLEQRMLAMAAGQLVGGLLYAAARWRMPPLDWRVLVVGLAPALIDVFSQTLGWRQSTGLLRTLTGGLFGVAFALWAYPLLDRLLDAAVGPLAGGPPIAGQGSSPGGDR
jgi:uncharacterized membrane protein